MQAVMNIFFNTTYVLDKNAHRLLSVSDSRASKTAAPINKYVNVHTTRDRVLTFCRFIVQDAKILITLSLPLGSRIWRKSNQKRIYPIDEVLFNDVILSVHDVHVAQQIDILFAGKKHSWISFGMKSQRLKIKYLDSIEWKSLIHDTPNQFISAIN